MSASLVTIREDLHLIEFLLCGRPLVHRKPVGAVTTKCPEVRIGAANVEGSRLCVCRERVIGWYWGPENEGEAASSQDLDRVREVSGILPNWDRSPRRRTGIPKEEKTSLLQMSDQHDWKTRKT